MRQLTMARSYPARQTTCAWCMIVQDAALTALEWMHACIARSRQRLALGHLDERLLRDIGRDRLTVAREIAKPPWRR